MTEEQYLGGQTGVTKTEFKERSKYLEYISSLEINFLDTLYDKKLYGMINDRYELTNPVPNVKNFGDYAPDVYGLNFVVDLFNNFRDFYSDLIRTSDISAPELISGLKPTKSFVDFDEGYRRHIRSAGIAISNSIIQSGQSEEMSFARFLEVTNSELFKRNNMKYKVSKSGFALSPESTVLQSGLYVDLGRDYSPNLDSLKVDLVSDVNFPCYAKYVQQYGFKIDFNNPWRIALDLESVLVQKNILNGRPLDQFYGFYSDVCTLKVGGDDFWAVKTFYELLYIQYSTDIGLGSIPSDFSLAIDTSEWVRLHLLNRFRELNLLNPNLQSSSLYEKISNKALDIYRLYGLQSNNGAISYINKYCSEILKSMIEG